MSKANDKQVGGLHYRSRIQHWDYVLANDIPYLEAQIIKYVTRHRKKNGLQDLEKAQHFLDKLMEEERNKLIPASVLTVQPSVAVDDDEPTISEWR